jgi:hypothetical protein
MSNFVSIKKHFITGQSLSGISLFASGTLIIPSLKVNKVKLSLQPAVKTHRVARRRGSHISYTIGSQMAVRLSAICTWLPLPPGRFLVLISVRS